MTQTEKSRISSRQTFLWKYVFPAVAMASLLFGMYIGWEVEFTSTAMISIYVSTGIFIAIYLYFFSSLKKVWIDDRYLYVSNFKEEEQIPLTQIDRISEMKIFNPRRITIHLKRPANFGRKIVFLGYHQQWLLFGTHPAITLIEKKLEKLNA